MPLGDSITARVGYREPLSIALSDEGYNKDFVGSRTSSCTDPCPYDPDHEGHGGWRPSEIATALPAWLESTPPDVVLLHIGTNELDVTGVADILNIINAHDPGVVILLARIINRQVYHPETSAFNRQIAALAEERIANGERIRVVDHESALVYPDDMVDMLHPNSSGFEKMKGVWLEDLRRFLPACSSAPPRFISNFLPGATVGEAYEFDMVAAGVPSVTFSLREGPAGLVLHEQTGRLTWPSPVVGSHAVSVVAANPWGNATVTLTLQVE